MVLASLGNGLTWEELGAAALARQFPEVGGRDADAVAHTVGLIGPIQSQTARSPFLGLAARIPGVTHEAITLAYEDFGIVRGSTIRGTVHTSTPEHNALLEAATRIGQRVNWVRTLTLDGDEPELLWAATEEFARDEWRTPDDLMGSVEAWMRERGGWPEGLDRSYSRYLAFGHGGLLRRPLKGGWEGQGAPGYRTAAAVLPGDRAAVLADPHALDDLFRVHLAAHGPASRHDLAWWSGLGLTRVDEVLSRLDLEGVPGPDGRLYLDLPDAPAPRDLPGVRLLPEYDALMCAYQPAARERFTDPAHTEILWNRANGLVLAPMLVDGRVTGYWRAMGSARKRPLDVFWFAGTRRPRKSELDEPVAALESALGITISAVTVAKHA